jgi:hypothetical protein
VACHAHNLQGRAARFSQALAGGLAQSMG